MGISQKYKTFKNVCYQKWIFGKVDILESMVISRNVKRIDQMWIFFYKIVLKINTEYFREKIKRTLASNFNDYKQLH